MSIFSNMIEEIMEVFKDDFSVYGTTFDHCLGNLDRVLQRCQEKDLILNWVKCQFTVREVIVLGHLVSERGIEVDKAKIEVIEQLRLPSMWKESEASLAMLDSIEGSSQTSPRLLDRQVS